MYKIALKPSAKNDGTHSIILRVVSKGTRAQKRIDKRITLKELPSVKPNQWNNEFGIYRKNFEGDYKAYNKMIEDITYRCDTIITDLRREGKLSVYSFIERFKNNSKKQTDISVADALTYKINRFQLEKSWGSYKVYAQTLRRWNAFLRHISKKRILLMDLSISDLHDFSNYLSTGTGNGGVLHRMRDLRASFNLAIKDELIPDTPSPFEKFDFTSVKSRGEKAQKPLTKEQWLDFKAYESDNKSQMFWKDVFIMMVQCYGINLKDLIALKHDNIIEARTEKGNIRVIRYVRRKVKKKRPDAVINIIINDMIQGIIDKYKSDSKYLMPILNSYDYRENSFEWEQECKKSALRFNYNLENISNAIGVPKKFSNYAARHTFATLLFWEKIDVRAISQALGHSDLKTTTTYLSKLDLVMMKDELKNNVL